MISHFALYMATSYVRSSWRSTFASILGIAASVLLLIVIISFANGLDEFLVERLLAASPHVVVEAGEGLFLENYATIKEKFNAIEGIVATSPYLLGSGILSCRGVSANVTIKGVEWAGEDLVTGIGSYIDEGEFGGMVSSGKVTEEGEGHQGDGVVVIGSVLAREVGARLGDRVSLLSYSGGRGEFLVKGIFSTGYYLHDSSLVYISLDLARALFAAPGVTGVGGRLRDPASASAISREIQRETGMWVRTWYEKNPSLLMSLALERKVMLGVVFFTFLVATFGVANLLYIQVLHKKESIGMLRALGVSGRALQGIFFLQGLILGSLGGILGCVMALLVISVMIRYPVKIPEIYYTGYIPIVMKWRDFLLAFLVAIVSTSIASIIPAFRASKVTPMESLRRT